MHDLKPMMFEKLATCAHDMELIMDTSSDQRLPEFKRCEENVYAIEHEDNFIPKTEIKNSM